MKKSKSGIKEQEADRAARKVRRHAHAPYSKYKVGAAVIASGRIFSGCNVENASFPAGLCAERSAVAAAVSAGCRRITYLAICVAGAPVPPCGMCLQVLSEFAGSDLPVSLIGRGKSVRTSLGDLLPHRFRPD